MSEETVPEEVAEVAETPTEETTPEVIETESDADMFAKRFAALSRREKQLLEEKNKAKEVESKWGEIEEAKKAGVMKLLEYHGLSIDDVISEALGEEDDTEIDPVDKIRQEFEAYKKEQEDKITEEKRKLEEENQNSIQKAIDNHKQAISSHISQNLDKYELINNQGEQDLVWEVTEAHFDEYGEVLSIEQAADKVEEYLENQVRDLLKLKKFSGREPVQDKDLGKKEAPTLNSRYSNSEVPVTEKSLTREESLKQAASLLKWK